MGFFDFFSGGAKPSSDKQEHGLLPYGKQKKGGGHDHRYNRGKDRTPRQLHGDAKRRK